MRLLALESDQDESGDLRGQVAINECNAGPDGGPTLATTAMLVDALGGMRSITASAPDWAFTADLSIHLLPTGPASLLTADLHVRRRGRRTLVIEAELHVDEHRPAGLAVMTFAVVDRPAHLVDIVIDMTPGRRTMAGLASDQAPPGRYEDELGIVEEEPGRVHLQLRPEVSNTVGALHGAVHTAVMDVAARSLARPLLGDGAKAVDLHLAFLELATTGPITAHAVAVGEPTGDRLVAVVELRDGTGRLCSQATTTVTVP